MVKEKVGENYLEVLSSVQGQLDQLAAECEDNEKAQNRIKSIKKQLEQIA